MKIKTLFFQQIVQPVAWNFDAVHILLGSLYIALLAQLEIPLVPVPVTLQTFAIFTLALFQGSKKSMLSLLLYLFEATIGLPVFPSGYVDPFWIFMPTAGYCLSFPLAAYLVGKFTELKSPFSFGCMALGLCCAQLVIYLMGVSWLSFFVGWEQAFTIGLLPFVLFDMVKLLAAASIKMTIRHLRGLI